MRLLGVGQGEARTDAKGRAVVHGPKGAKLWLRTLGDRHESEVKRGVLIGATAPVQVTVTTGATISGRVVPANLVAQLKADVGVEAARALRLFRDSGERPEPDYVRLPRRPHLAEVA